MFLPGSHTHVIFYIDEDLFLRFIHHVRPSSISRFYLVHLILLVKAEEFLLMAQSNTGECVKENDSWVGIEQSRAGQQFLAPRGPRPVKI
jgi:hypothetical protein